MSDLQNKVGIVTGGSSGIGFRLPTCWPVTAPWSTPSSRTERLKEGMGGAPESST